VQRGETGRSARPTRERDKRVRPTLTDRIVRLTIMSSYATNDVCDGIVRFGTFEMDLHGRELRKRGLKVRLQEQPFQVLAALVMHAGELVRREQLRQWVWPEDTFVEFDHALNTAVKKIRFALGDDANTPRYVETVPRHGYRFIAPVSGASLERTARDKNAPEAAQGGARRLTGVPGGIVIMAAGLVLGFLAGGSRKVRRD
jgi:DNA-binding winged helix-turn-helix (wHTH) protein